MVLSSTQRHRYNIINNRIKKMDISQKVLVQAVLSMFEIQLQNTEVAAAVDYTKQRVGYFEERCCDLNSQNKGPLSLSEIVELYEITTHYCYALEAEDKSEPSHRYYVAHVNQVRER